MDKFKDYFLGFDFLKDIFLIILGMIIGGSWQYIKRKVMEKDDKCKLDKTRNFYYENGIISLAHAYPYYEYDNIACKYMNEKFYIPIPEEQKKIILELDKNFNINDNKYFNKLNIMELEDDLKMPNLHDLVNKHSILVAKEIIKSINNKQIIFNGKKFGIKSITAERSTDKEIPTLILEIYKTDYFTHMVMKSIFKELKGSIVNISKEIKLNEVIVYYPFTTSLGINTLVITKDNKIAFCKRSRYVSNMNGKSKWHVSMNEGVSITDFKNNGVDLYKAVRRGLNEELGIKEDYIISNTFGDLFVVADNLELGLTNIVKLKIDFNELKECYNTAQDSPLETDEIIPVSINKRELKKFIKENEGNITLACEYSINMLIGRGNNIY